MTCDTARSRDSPESALAARMARLGSLAAIPPNALTSNDSFTLLSERRSIHDIASSGSLFAQELMTLASAFVSVSAVRLARNQSAAARASLWAQLDAICCMARR